MQYLMHRYFGILQTKIFFSTEKLSFVAMRKGQLLLSSVRQDESKQNKGLACEDVKNGALVSFSSVKFKLIYKPFEYHYPYY